MAAQTVAPSRTGVSSGLSRVINDPWKVGGTTGILFVIAFVVGILFQGETPLYDDPIGEIRDFWTDKSDVRQFLIFDGVITLGFVLFFLPFISSLRSVLGPADRSGGMWARLTFGGGIIFLVLGAASSVSFGGLAMLQGGALNGGQALDEPTLRFAMAMNAYGFAAPAIAILLIPASIVTLTSGVVWRWLGWLGLLAAVISLVATFATVERESDGVLNFLGFIAFIGLGIWILGMSIAMLRHRSVDATM